MYLKYLQMVLPQFDEIRVIGKIFVLNSISGTILGLVRKGKELKLYVLQFDELVQETVQTKRDIEVIARSRNKSNTNRQEQLREVQTNNNSPFQQTREIRIDNAKLVVSSITSSKFMDNDWHGILILTEFLKAGWEPKNLEWQKLTDLILTEITLKDEYDAISFGENIGSMEFSMGLESRYTLVQKKMNLKIGEKFPQKFIFTDKETKEKHGFYMHRVYLMDIWKEQEERFKDPRYLEMMSVDQFEEMKTNLYQNLSKICPKGMYFPVLEYETENDISLEFYAKEYLDAEVESSHGEASSMLIFQHPDAKIGNHGKKLKAAVIQTPVMADTKEIAVELFRYGKSLQRENIVVK